MASSQPDSPGPDVERVELQELERKESDSAEENEPEPVTNGSVNADDASVTIGFSGDHEKRESGGDGDRETRNDMPLTIRIRQQAKDSVRRCCSVATLKKKLPILQWLPSYRCREFQCDLIAGLTVGLTVIPQGLAYAVIAGLPPQYGLYSAFMGCFVYMFMGTSKDITVGPTAIMSLLVATFAVPPIEGNVDQAIILAIVLTLMSGLVQLVMGLLNLGILVNYISHPVINSFTSAAAITIGCGQVKNVLGLKNIPREFLHMVYETCAHIPETRVWDLVMGLVSMVFLFLLKKLRTIKYKDEQEGLPVPIYKQVFRKILWLVGTDLFYFFFQDPFSCLFSNTSLKDSQRWSIPAFMAASNAIIVITAAGVTVGLINYDIHVISITGNITSGLPPVGLPRFSGANMTVSEVFSTIGPGFVVVPLLGLVETIAISKAFARLNNYKIDPTQELLAIGSANVISSFFHSYPITGSFSRTAVNSQCQVKTPAAGLFCGALILLALEVLVPYCYYIPKSALAAVIIMAVIQMVDYKIIPILWRTNKWDLFVHVVVFICSLSVGIEYGILIGIAISLGLLLYPMARPKLKTDHQPHVVVIQPDQGLFFPAIEYLEQKIHQIALADEKPKPVILDMSRISGLDYSSLHGMKSLVVEGSRKGIRIVIAGATHEVADELEKENISGLRICTTVPDALAELRIQAQSGPAEEEPFIDRL